MWVVSWMESNSSSVSCIHMLCMCSLLSTSFKFSLCGCVFYTFSMFVALSCAFFRRILLFISKAVASSSDTLQPFGHDLWKMLHLPPSPFHPGCAAATAAPWAALRVMSSLGEPLVLPRSFVRRWRTSSWCLQWCLLPFKIYRLLGKMIWIWWQAQHLFWWILSLICQFF